MQFNMPHVTSYEPNCKILLRFWQGYLYGLIFLRMEWYYFSAYLFIHFQMFSKTLLMQPKSYIF